jgi:hypothetical protein
MAETVEELQRRMCREYGVDYTPPAPGSKVGIALQTLDRWPIHGVRLPPTETTCGWYIFAGDEWSDDPDFYKPMCVEHMWEHCPLALAFLCLPPGWRFHIDGKGGYGASFDEQVLQQEQNAEPAAAPDRGGAKRSRGSKSSRRRSR